MDRRSVLKNAGIAGILAAGAAPAVHAQAALRWRIASSFPKSLDTIYGSADVFASAVKRMTGGKFDISVHQAGELMPAFNVVDGVQSGTVEMCHTAPYYFFGKNEVFAIGGAIDREIMHEDQRAVFGELQIELNHLRAESHGLLESRNRVFRLRTHRAAMRAQPA